MKTISVFLFNINLDLPLFTLQSLRTSILPSCLLVWPHPPPHARQQLTPFKLFRPFPLPFHLPPPPLYQVLHFLLKNNIKVFPKSRPVGIEYWKWFIFYAILVIRRILEELMINVLQMLYNCHIKGLLQSSMHLKDRALDFVLLSHRT